LVVDQFQRIRRGELDPTVQIWRYFTFPKFISLLVTQSLWFSKLQILSDCSEGLTPEPARAALKQRHREIESWFQEEHLKQQTRQFVEENENDGRELIVANCWFIGTQESIQMWNTYVGNVEGVAIQSTASALANSLAISHDQWWIGKINYVDFARHEMTAYEANQACVRAFIKNEDYSHENELRVATMNFVAPGCLNPDGSPPDEKQKSGLVYSESRPGILVRTNLPTLIHEVRTAPKVSNWHHNLIKLLVSRSVCGCPVAYSEHRKID